MGEAILSVQGLGVMRGARSVLADLSWELHPASLLAILGPNGAGKSTLLKAIAGLLPYEGTIQLDERNLARFSRRERARWIAYVPQHSVLEAPLAVREVVAHGRYAHRDALAPLSRADEAAVDRALARTDTARLADRPFSRLSYGERRLVLLARALATEARVLLLDEPTAALDVSHALSLLGVLRGLADEGTGVIVVLHQLQEAAIVCDRALLLSEGRCAAWGTAAEVIAAGPVRRVYGVELVPAAHFGYRRPTE